MLIKDDNVDLIALEGREIYLLGTAHVSPKSVELVERTIEAVNPDAIAVELCEGRYQSILDPDRWKRTNLVTVVREGRAYVLLTQLLLASYQRRLGLEMDCKPGAEMLAAVKAVKARNIPCALADREIGVTLKRAISSLGVWGFCKLLFSGVMGMLQKPEKIGEEEIERLKSSDALEEILREFGSLLPNVQKALITERDIFLAQKIREAKGQRIVAVVGAAHVPGIKSYITADSDLSALLTIPPKSFAIRALGWAFPVLIVVGMVYALFTSGSEGFTKALTTWFWMTGVAGALGAAVVRAHPLTIIASFIAAPIAALHPLLATGWVAGLVEAMVRKPRVQDLETIAEDMSSLKGMLSNRVSRTLLVVAVTNLFVMGGMALAARAVFSIASGGT